MSFDRPIQRSARQYDIAALVGQTVFTFPDPLFDPADLVVSVQPDASLSGFMPVSSDAYAIALTPGLSNATVTFITAPCRVAGTVARVRLSGQRVQDRIGSVTRGGTFIASAYETELDRQTVVLQELRRDISYAVSEVMAILSGAVAFPTAASARAIGAAPLNPTGVRRSAFLRAAEITSPGSVLRLSTHIPSDPKDPLTLAWLDPFVEPGSLLATTLAAQEGWNATVLLAVFVLAGGVLSLGGTVVPWAPTASSDLVTLLIAALQGLPAAQPATGGQLWWNGGVLCRS